MPYNNKLTPKQKEFIILFNKKANSLSAKINDAMNVLNYERIKKNEKTYNVKN